VQDSVEFEIRTSRTLRARRLIPSRTGTARRSRRRHGWGSQSRSPAGQYHQRRNPLYAGPSLRRRLRNQQRVRPSLTTHLQSSLSCHARISDGVTDYMITGALLVYRILLASLSAALNHCIGFAPIGMPFVADVPFISNSGDSNFPNTGCIFDTTSGVGGVFVMTK